MVKKHKTYRGRIASVVAASAILLIASICLYLLNYSRNATQSMVGQTHLSVMVIDQSAINPTSTAKWIESIEGVKSAKYIDSTDAQREFSDYLGVNLTSVMGEGVIPSSYVVTLDASNGGKRQIEKVKQQIAAADWVESVSYEQEMVEQLDVLSARVDTFTRYFVMLIISLLVVLLYVVCRLSVGLTANAMPQAPERYVRRVAMQRAMIDATTAGVCSTVVLVGGIYSIDTLYPTLDLPFDTLPLIACSVLVAGVVAGILFTYISTLQISSK